ncbi:MAG: hypothetical protein ABI175_00455 [Polyangiales bacterium]
MPRKNVVRFYAIVVIAAIAVGTTFCASRAEAAGPWVDRTITLPRHDWSFDLGLGVAHRNAPDPFPQPTGVGMNFEFAVAVIQHLELGFRTGARFGNDGRGTQADEAGRIFDRQTFGTRTDPWANPEARVRGSLVHGRVVELALEGRAAFPFESGSRFGAMFGMPLAFHIDHSVRLDMGVYVPVLFYDPTITAVSLPLDVWIQATRNLWLGPMTGVRFEDFGRDREGRRTDVSLGFGLGYQVHRVVDLKTMALFPGINHTEGARNFNAGFGVQIRIE